MAKGAWKKPVCKCGSCKKCKDRARLAKKRAGTWKREPSKKFLTRLEALSRKTVQKALQAAQLDLAAEAKAADAPERARAKAERERRNKVLGHLVRSVGIKKARY